MTKQAEPPIKVLFAHYGEEWIRGSETLLIDLLRGLDPSKVRPVIWCNGAKLEEACRREGWQTFRSDFELYLDYDSPRVDVRKYLGLVREAKKLIGEIKPAVIHVNSAGPAQWMLPAAMACKVPSVVHLHIDYLPRSRIVFLTHAATRVVGVSKQVLEGPLADGLPPERSEVIYNGIDFARIPASSTDLRKTLGIDAGAFVVTTAGSLIRRKGHDVLIRAFADMRIDRPSHLLIPSGGPERASLEALVAELGLSDRVHFLGYIDDIPSVYQAADVFGLASRADAFGLVLAEAGHFGLPACATTVGGIPEVVANGETGLLVPPDDRAAFASALSRLAGDADLRQKMGDAARVRVGSMFSSQEMARRFENLYDVVRQEPAGKTGFANATRLASPMIAWARRKLAKA